ncbi:MAG: RelA/SpoT family protein [Bacteroidota bacterium]|nr:RelA/SpoT family protein [Bacteroidota bacterium]
MSSQEYISADEAREFIINYRRLLKALEGTVTSPEIDLIKTTIKEAINQGFYQRKTDGIHPLVRLIVTANILNEEIGLKKTSIISWFLYESVVNGIYPLNDLQKKFGADSSTIIRGLSKINELYAKNPSIESENFSKLFITFSEDVRVVLIMLADRLFLLRSINHHPNDDFRRQVAYEASYLYAPLAHRLGLYRVKSEMEDLSLKYTNREIYTEIAKKLSETKRSRDTYIYNFIEPVKTKLEAAGLKFSIKGRTKSIHSIWNKIRKQEIAFEKIYDLFAIRIIIDTPYEKEKSDCWHAYSIVTDMYQPNPKRLRDWLSIPKSNGYESLHITVMGPEGKWVEVQIRTERMDEIAEKGLAAHWKYKGVKGESGLDEWLNNVREVLEASDASPLDVMQELKPDLYDKEIFVFTPKGDLHKLPKGATILDFAFLIHTKLGSKCVGAKVNGKNVTIKHKLASGDQVEILTAATQVPKQDWLNIVTTSKARIKIKHTLKEMASKEAEYGKELLQRRFKNRKIEIDESILMKLIKKNGFKQATDFFADLATEKLDINKILEQYLSLEGKEKEPSSEGRTATGFVAPAPTPEHTHKKDDELVIDQNLRGVEYKLAKCCNPIYGDEIFGFISTQGGIKIHRTSCANAPQMISRFGYRIVKAKWTGKSDSQYAITLHVLGNDDIGIVTNITSVISKEKNVILRSISIDSHDGLFSGNITISIGDTGQLEALIKKIRTIKGVKKVERGSQI